MLTYIILALILIQSQQISAAPNAGCCVITSCDLVDHTNCSDSVNCGYICTKGNYPVADYSYTPGYILKKLVRENVCHFGVCQSFIMTCSHCPNPRHPNFNVNLVRSDCKKCYSKVDLDE